MHEQQLSIRCSSRYPQLSLPLLESVQHNVGGHVDVHAGRSGSVLGDPNEPVAVLEVRRLDALPLVPHENANVVVVVGVVVVVVVRKIPRKVVVVQQLAGFVDLDPHQNHSPLLHVGDALFPLGKASEGDPVLFERLAKGRGKGVSALEVFFHADHQHLGAPKGDARQEHGLHVGDFLNVANDQVHPGKRGGFHALRGQGMIGGVVRHVCVGR
mmetsp:Transcript_21725/g.51564  ORF Transcript_21725/g.51564 Transcript_21725/m.51564 type:complete len:213 (-) Transcript_21725:124-762(-)